MSKREKEAEVAVAAVEPKRVYKIVEKTWLWYLISGTIILTGVIAIALNGLNFGIDFTGGTNLTLKFQQQTSTGAIRDLLKTYGLESPQIQKVGTDMENTYLIRSRELQNQERIAIVEQLTKALGSIEVLEVDTIGPSVGKELQSQSLWIVLSVLGMLMLYITFRFEFWSGLAALGALAHDALVTVGFVALFRLEVDVALIVAILTILGYSINDTIVIFDRIRENMAIYKKRIPFIHLCNISLTQTMSRSINTALTVLIAILALILFGGATIRSFALVLFVGITTGMYSSIFNATPILVSLRKIKL